MDTASYSVWPCGAPLTPSSVFRAQPRRSLPGLCPLHSCVERLHFVCLFISWYVSGLLPDLLAQWPQGSYHHSQILSTPFIVLLLLLKVLVVKCLLTRSCCLPCCLSLKFISKSRVLRTYHMPRKCQCTCSSQFHEEACYILAQIRLDASRGRMFVPSVWWGRI